MNQLPRSTGVLAIAVMLAVSAGVGAREVRLQGPNGTGGTCPEAAVEDDAPASAPKAHKRAATGAKAKATTMLRSDNGGTAARPRWHSILPGMFR